MASERYKVRVTKDYLVFCSGHFISYEGDKCERLHGHNYRAAIEIEGALDENFYVFDFILLKARAKLITDELDHRMMLPTKNRVIHLGEASWQLHGARRPPAFTLRERPPRCAGTSSRSSATRWSSRPSSSSPSAASTR